jgi:glycosyltransferase involved in cell wall biosynthesis
VLRRAPRIASSGAFAVKVGIDVHSLGTRSGGNETYYRELLGALQQVDSEIRYFLYGIDPEALSQQGDRERFQCRPVSASRYLRIPFSLPQSAKRDDLDLFHAQFIVPPGLRCKTVTTIPDIAFERFPEWFPLYQRRWSRYLIRRSAHKADHIITVSENSKRDLINIYQIAADNVTVIYPAPDKSFRPYDKKAAQARIALQYGILGDFILYIGRLQGRKNLLRLVDAFAQMGCSNCRKLVLAGSPDTLFAPVRKRIAEQRLQQVVLLPGYIPAEDLPWLYSAADLFVYPSLYEGFGLPVVEAMACGVPVVTSKGSSLDEVAGDAALLCNPLDTNSIAACLDKALGSESLRMQLSRAGLDRSRHFTHHSMASATISVYEQVLAGPNAFKTCSTSLPPKATVCH